MKSQSYDVAIVGGGPGGSATALSLRSRTPSLSVVLIEASSYEAVRIGETLPPPARTFLEHLGVWESFQTQCHRKVYGTSASWGGSVAQDNDFFYMPANTGWHLDRAAFDRMLAEEAQRRGAALLLDTRVYDSKRADDEWRLVLSTGSTLAARFLVDATGNAALARRYGARSVEADCLIGVAGFFERCDRDPRTTIEAFEQGWWYTAGLPNGGRIIACMTDADLARRLKLRETDRWLERLDAMPIIGAIARGNVLAGPLVIRSASSRRLEPAAGANWMTVGDSASRFDPLSSQGIVKALRSGVFASYAIGDLLTQADDSGLDRYRRYVADEFESYLKTRAKYYREEQRWPSGEFWRRRNASAHMPAGSRAARR